MTADNKFYVDDDYLMQCREKINYNDPKIVGSKKDITGDCVLYLANAKLTDDEAYYVDSSNKYHRLELLSTDGTQYLYRKTS